MLNYSAVLEKFGNNCFSKNELISEIRQIKPDYNDENLKRSLSRLIKSGKLNRIAKGIYIVPKYKKLIYSYESMNSTAIDVKNCIINDFPLIDFIMLEMVQFNEFMNHQIAQNTIFIETERDVDKAVFERLKENYNSVLYFPKLEVFFLYREADCIVIKSLPYRYPKNIIDKHGISIEKLIVDLFSNELIKKSLNGADYPEALRDIFSKYQINETRLFGYAALRRVDSELKKMLNNEEIKLYTR
jgi:hypothetical protein